MYRCYCNGQEFGVDYATLADARAAMTSYRKQFPHLKYYARKTNKQRLSELRRAK